MKPIAVVIGAVVVLGGLAAGVWALRGTGISTLVRDPRWAVKPAKLVPVHEAVKELAECNACHALGEAIPREKCLVCHDVIGDRRRAREGHHGRNLLGTCHDCHVDHEAELIIFDRTSFNHEQAVFPLRGTHAAVACEECHERPTGVAEQPTRMQYIGLPHESCGDCHDDPHADALTGDTRSCVECHDQDAWTGRHLRFVHDRDSEFRLDGKHADVACTGCHLPPEGSERLADAQLAGVGTSCAACHDDPHAAQFGETACAVCHDTSGFDGPALAFDHADVPSFRLEGAHATVACVDCHLDDPARGARRFRGTADECAGCHDDPHGTQFVDTSCETCHQVQAFTGSDLRFDHRSVVEFPLSGKHVTVPCAKCHEPADGAVTKFRGTSLACATCHKDPHAEQFAETSCATCHRDSGFTAPELLFRHERVESFQLTGAHAAVACASCHRAPIENTPVVFRGTSTACATCHDDAHAGSVVEKECSACHTTPAWTGKALLFDHARDAAFALDATHERRPCSGCHDQPSFDAPSNDCAGCHVDVASSIEGKASVGGVDTSFEASPHAGLVSCGKCHAPEDATASTAVIAPRCASCHNARYAKLALDRRTLVDDLMLRGRRALVATPDRADAGAVRERLDALHRIAAHDFAPAERRLRELVQSLED